MFLFQMERSLYSQLNQDLWVLKELGYKKNGTFLDIGAHDGINLSNTYLLEKDYGWNGLCIDANPDTFEKLKQNRNTCVCSLLSEQKNKDVMLNKIGELSFTDNENQAVTVDAIERSYNMKIDGVLLKTNTLDCILEDQNIPTVIDYLSIDIEGMELKALSTMDFNKYHVNLITIEHNACHIGNEYRNQIHDFVSERGFEFVKGNENVQNWDSNKYYIEDFYKNKTIM